MSADNDVVAEVALRFLWKWIHELSLEEITAREFLSVVTHSPATPEWVKRSPGAPR